MIGQRPYQWSREVYCSMRNSSVNRLCILSASADDLKSLQPGTTSFDSEAYARDAQKSYCN